MIILFKIKHCYFKNLATNSTGQVGSYAITQGTVAVSDPWLKATAGHYQRHKGSHHQGHSEHADYWKLVNGPEERGDKPEQQVIARLMTLGDQA
jgi:hypothetical protein